MREIGLWIESNHSPRIFPGKAKVGKRERVTVIGVLSFFMVGSPR
jgi:hypothetical protein